MAPSPAWPAHASLPEGVDGGALLEALRPLAWGASAILRAYARGDTPPHGFPPALTVDQGGEGPVSAADLAVNRWLLDGLAAAVPHAPWSLLSEETAKDWLASGQPIANEWLWVLDPLDGTRDFLKGNGEYAVHLALVRGHTPVLGLILLPELEELWFGILPDSPLEDGAPGVAWCETACGDCLPPRLSDRQQTADLVLVASRSHRDQRLEQLVEALRLGPSRAMGSVGGKVATILRGEADLYLSLSGKSAPKDWDMAAPEAVLRAAGGGFSHADGRALHYNTGHGLQAGCLIASHGPAHQLLCERAREAMARIDPGFPL
ncbi:MAG: 3'(2'),5'-bisphosphate nucleotidase CysQ [Cyanobacteriota bacterium]